MMVSHRKLLEKVPYGVGADKSESRLIFGNLIRPLEANSNMRFRPFLMTVRAVQGRTRWSNFGFFYFFSSRAIGRGRYHSVRIKAGESQWREGMSSLFP